MNNLPALPPEQQALKNIKGKITDEDFKALKNYVERNVISLGTDQAFALRDNDGDIRAFKQRVHLSEDEGTLTQPVYGGPYVISAQGYEVLSEATGTCVIFPKEVLVANQWKPNPYAERDETNRRILAVHARAVAFRFSSKGIPQVSDWSTIFDTPSYRLIDLLAKAKKFPQAFQLLPQNKEPVQDEKSTWASYPFDESTNLWVNTQHLEAMSWYSQIINREKKAIDFAQTFARRNAVKHLLGLQAVPGQSKNKSISEWNLTVLCWRPTNNSIIKWDMSRYADLQDTVGNMIEGQQQFEQIEMKTGAERVSEEEGSDKIEAEIDPEDQEVIEVEGQEVPKDDPTPKTKESQNPEKLGGPNDANRKTFQPQDKNGQTHKLTKEEQHIVDQNAFLIENFEMEYYQAIDQLDLRDKELDFGQMAKIFKAVNSLLDQAT